MTKPAAPKSVTAKSTSAAKPVAKPAAKAPAKPVTKPTAKPAAKPVVKSVVKPVAKPVVKPAAKPAAKAPTKPVAKTAAPAAASSHARSAPKAPAKTPVKSAKTPVKPVVEAEPAIIKSHLPKKDLEFHRGLLLRLRDRIVDEISFLANDSLNRSQKDSSGDLSSHSFHMADQGTDNFDREFAANLLSSEQDVLYEIDEALRRIDQGTYGICEMSGKPIEKERLKFLPFARYCVAVQSEMERGKPRYRPFRRTSIQTAEVQN